MAQRINLTSEDIEKLLIDSNPRFENCRFEDHEIIDLSSWGGSQLNFNNIEAKGLSIVNSKNQINIFIANSTGIESLRMESCSIKYFRIDSCEMEGNIGIVECNFMEIEFYHSKILKGRLKISRSTITSKINFDVATIDNGISLNRCENIGNISMNSISCQMGEFGIIQSSIKGYFRFSFNVLFHLIRMESSNFGGDFQMNYGAELHNLFIIDCTFTKAVRIARINNVSLSPQSINIKNDCIIEKSEFGDGFELTGAENMGCSVENIYFNCNQSLKGISY